MLGFKNPDTSQRNTGDGDNPLFPVEVLDHLERKLGVVLSESG